VAKSLRYNIPIRPLTVTLGDDLSGDTIGRIPTSWASAPLSRHASTGKGGKPHKIKQGAKQIKSLKDSHFMAFPRLSISSRRNFSVSVAREALERATLTLAVTTFSSCCVRLS
jgi:hypothetical protein